MKEKNNILGEFLYEIKFYKRLLLTVILSTIAGFVLLYILTLII